MKTPAAVCSVLLVIGSTLLASPTLQASASSKDDLPLQEDPFLPNVRINDVVTGRQSEVSLAVTPQGTLYAGWNDESNGYHCGWSRSVDGGMTWSPTKLSFQSGGDPVVTSDEQGNLYRVCMGGGIGGFTFYVQMSADQGISWGPATSFPADDKPWMAARDGKWWISYWGVYVVRSDDGGVTWLPPVHVANGTGTCIVADAKGNLYLSFVELKLPGDILFSRSTDGGLNWSTPVLLGRSVTQTNMHCDVDESGTHAYIAWSGTPDRYDDIWVVHSSDGGASWGAPVKANDDAQQRLANDRPDLAVDVAGTVHLAWFDRRDGTGAAWYSNSTDHGATWSRNIRVTDAGVGKDCGGAFNHYSELVITPYGDVAYAWCDARDGANLGDPDVWFATAPIAAGRLPKKQLGRIEVEPSSATISVQQTQQLSAKGFDTNGSPMPIRPVWTASAGNVDSTGLYTPGPVGGHVVRASWGAVSGSANIAVTPGPLALMELSPRSATITDKGTVRFAANGSDSKGNPVIVSPQWSATGGVVDSSGLFTPDSVGVFTVTAADGGISASAQVSVGSYDTIPPVILHSVPGPVASGSRLLLRAIVTDENLVDSVVLRYAAADGSSFTSVLMKLGSGGEYEGVVPDVEVRPDSVSYYIEAKDAAGNRASSPASAPDERYQVMVLATPDPAPSAPGPRGFAISSEILFAVAAVAIAIAVAAAAISRRRNRLCPRCGVSHGRSKACAIPAWRF